MHAFSRSPAALVAAFALCVLFAASTHATADSPFSAIECDACEAMVGLLDVLARGGATETIIVRDLSALCVKLNIQDASVCAGLIGEFAPTVLPIVVHEGLDPKSVCVLLRLCSATPKLRAGTTVESMRQRHWPVAPSDGRSNRVGKDALRVLHISDLHVDTNYTVGSPADCSQPLCCRPDSPSKAPFEKAGAWGSYHCDAPVTLVKHALSAAASKGPFDAVFWTGDSPPHDIWRQSKASNLARVQLLTDMITEAFPGVPVFPAVGNHDTFPVDQYSERPTDSIHHDDFVWLRTALSHMWGHWAPANGTEQQADLLKHGCFSSLLAPGLRVLAMNTQWGDLFNAYILLKSEHQEKAELNWMQQALWRAKQSNEKCVIIGHIPPQLSAPDVLSSYGDDYQAIVSNFSDTIVGQFFAHTHMNEFSIIREGPTQAPVGVILVVPSITPYTMHNPTFRVLDFENTDGAWDFTDYEQYWANLSAANEDPSVGPQWELEFTAKDYFGLKDMSAKSWLELTYRMNSSRPVFDKYWEAFNVQMRPLPRCDDLCQRMKVCQCSTGDPTKYDECGMIL